MPHVCQVSAPKKVPERAIVRRVPVQERSKKRVEAILDAAAVAFAELGFDAATTESIAAEAGTSIGSVYQFFPNKLALFEALAGRCLDRSRETFDALFSSIAEQPWTEALDFAIDGLRLLQESDPAFRALLVNFHLYGVFEKADVAMTHYFIDRLGSIVKAHAPRLSAVERKVVATTLVNVIQGSLFLVRREDPAFAKRLLDETKVVLRRYLEPYTRA